ncbi:U11/U12 small nuclear ribonucleoprotein [Dirofilaria immitis]
MLTLSVLVTLLAVVIVDSLILYYPVYPNYIAPKYLRNFERNTPPRVFARDPDIPSSGIVYLKKNLQASLPNLQDELNLEKSIDRQMLNFNRSKTGQQKMEAVNEASVTANSRDISEKLSLFPIKSVQLQVSTTSAVAAAGVNSTSSQQSGNKSIRYFVIFDPKSKQFVTSNEPKSSKWNENDIDDKPVSNKSSIVLSKPYYEGTVQLISPEKKAKVALFSQLTELESDQRVESVAGHPTELTNDISLIYDDYRFNSLQYRSQYEWFAKKFISDVCNLIALPLVISQCISK